MARVEPIAPRDWTEEQRQRLQPIADATGAYNILGIFARHWDAFEAKSGWNAHLMGPGATLDVRLRELVILRVAFVFPCEYEWAQHKPTARRAGISDAEIERIKIGGGAPGWTHTEAALLDMTDDLNLRRTISDAVWTALTSTLSVQQILDAIYLVGNYATLAMIANAVELEIERGSGMTGFDPDRPF